MITHLHISNYALIDSLDIDLQSGYTVITGETGAGKSILLGALGLLLGSRADARVVKQGEQKCIVEAVFSMEGLDLSGFFADNDLDYDAQQCVVRRELTATGKSRAFVNDSPVLLSVLRPLGLHLVDIHSQHQNLLLGDEAFLVEVLDMVADNAAERQQYTESYVAYQDATHALEQLRTQAARDQKEQDYLRYQLQQLTDFNPQADEQQALEDEQLVLAHAEEIKEGLYAASGALQGDEDSVMQRIRHAAGALDGVGKHLSVATELAERLESVRIELADITAEVESHAESIEFNPQRMAFVDERLAALYRLARQFEVETEADLLMVMENLDQRLSAIDNIDGEIARLSKVQETARRALLAAGSALTATRSAAAQQTGVVLTDAISRLGMPHGQVIFDITPLDTPAVNGMDNISLLFSANKNVAPQNVQDIASGGEVARLMLALKAHTARYRQLPTIIFDEIDTGVSGTMAECMGNAMQELSCHCQVICITHLPQIAALGNNHLRVMKVEDDAGTHSRIMPLTPEERIHELANMLSGSEMTEAAINNAKALLGVKVDPIN